MIRIYVSLKFCVINPCHNSLDMVITLQQCYSSLLYTKYIK